MIDYAIKVRIDDAHGELFEFPHQKTMYAGKGIAAGDTVYLFASENAGGSGLVAKGVIVAAATAKTHGIARQTPRVSVTVSRTVLATRALGRHELKPFADRNAGRPETEFHFKFYRQATDKIVGLSAEAATYLERCFR